MKHIKTFLIAFIMLFAFNFNVSAQNEIYYTSLKNKYNSTLYSFYMSENNNKPVIFISKQKNDDWNSYLYVYNIQKFYDYLNEIKTKTDEWVNVCRENNIDYVKKEYPFELRSNNSAKYVKLSSKYINETNYSVTIKAEFIYSKHTHNNQTEENCYISLYIISSKSVPESITLDLSGIEQLNNLIEIINPQNVNSKYQEFKNRQNILK